MSILSRIDCGNARQESTDLYESAREIVVQSDGQSETCELAPFLPSVAGEDLIGGSHGNPSISSSSEGEHGWSDEVTLGDSSLVTMMVFLWDRDSFWEEAEAFEKFEVALEKRKTEEDRQVAARE
ncbi:hypothetical protein FOZ62_010186 [Perkinsus olseni]|uniref:Uncharacterized protein n=1 Tax=Perkinsus olseni TaxID=32597 RepID=A0A7J6QM83_PEROL|nr:hypothetical protein FOZ62_010186 [Perkinsus olseni]